MTAETPCENTQVRAPSPPSRKRLAAEVIAHHTGANAVEAKKKAIPTVANNGWGELFKNKETFVEMHLC